MSKKEPSPLLKRLMSQPSRSQAFLRKLADRLDEKAARKKLN